MTLVARRKETGAGALVPEPLIEELDALLAALREPRERIESSFVEVGNGLSESAQLLSRITALFEGLPQDLDGEEICEATERLQNVIAQAQTVSDGSQDEKERLDELARAVKVAEGPILNLRKAIKMIGIVAINARVYVAGIVGDSAEFDVFTKDITRLAKGAADTVSRFYKSYSQLAGEVAQAVEQRSQFQAHHHDTLTRVAEQLMCDLKDVTARREAAAKGSAETTAITRRITGSVGKTVMAMQVGDATRQRIEHVEAGLERLRGLASGEGPDTATVAPGDCLGVSAAIAGLQEMLIDGIASDFSREVGEAEAALHALAAEADAVMGQGHNLVGAGQGGESELARLGRNLRNIVSVLHRFGDERRKLDRMAISVGDTVEELLGHVAAVRAIEADMRVVTLNAAIKCAKLGDRGRSLDVIANQLREMTGETVESANAAMAKLNDAAEFAHRFTESATGEATGKVAGIEKEVTSALDLMEAVDNQLSEALRSLDSDGEAVRTVLNQASRGFSGQSRTVQSLRDVQARIRALACGLDDGADGDDAATAAVLAELRKSYTMDSERALHDGFAARFGGDHPSPLVADLGRIDEMLF